MGSDPAVLISLVIAFVGAVVPLYAMLIIRRQDKTVDWESLQRDRIKDLLDQLATCATERKRLQDENILLLRKIVEQGQNQNA